MDINNLNQSDKNHIWHPCSQMKDYENYPSIPVKKAKGVWLYTADGRKILDAISSWWTNIFGHGNDHIKKSIKKQLDLIEHVIFANYTHEPAVRLAQNLVSLFNGNLNKVFFTDNGSSAVEAAIKMSFQYWGQQGRTNKKHFAYLKGSYHGETIGALSVGSIDIYKNIYQKLLFDSFGIDGADCYRCPMGLARSSCSAECFINAERFLTDNHDKIAAFIIEPVVQFANGMNIYSPLYLKKLSELCSKLKIHLICDEIATGFGRTGKMTASGHALITPDFALFSKGLTGGFLPLSVVLVKDEIYAEFYAPYADLKAFMHSHSYTGNPLACSAANAVFDIFNKKDILKMINEKGNYIKDKIYPLNSHKNVGEIRSIGMITAIEIVEDKKSKKSFDWKKRTGYKIYRFAEKNGVLLRNLGDVIYFLPPYIINKKEMDFMTDTAVQSINEILKD